MTNEEKKKLLLDLIDKLCSPNFSKSEDEINLCIQQLTEIYADGYRHSYSDLFYKLQEILLRDSEDSEILGENINVLEQHITQIVAEDKENSNLQRMAEGYKKFADHIRLEIGRYNFIKGRFEQAGEKTSGSLQDIGEIEKKVNTVSEAVNQMRPIVTNAQKSLDNLDPKLENNKISSITALTIFSAVVLAFSGGLTFEAGMLQGMQFATAYRLVFTISLTGFILFNTIFTLLYLVGKMAGKHISTKCKYNSTDEKDRQKCRRCGDGYCTRAYNDVSIICRILHKYWYVAAIDLILLWVMYADFILWFYKPKRLDNGIIGGIFFPTSFIVLFYLVWIIQRWCQKKRNVLLQKVKLVDQLLYPEDYENGLFGMMKIISSAVAQVVRGKNKDIVERYYDYIAEYDPQNDYKKILHATNIFVEENLIDEEDTTIISWNKNKLNKKKWKILEGRLQQHLIEQSQEASQEVS